MSDRNERSGLSSQGANRYGYGLHSVTVRGCPNCGGEVQHEQYHGTGSVLNYTRCYECAPMFPTLGYLPRLLIHWFRKAKNSGESPDPSNTESDRTNERRY